MRRPRRIAAASAAAAVLLFAAAAPLAAEVITLREAIDRALAKNLGIERRRADVAVADATVRLALAERLPRLQVGGQGTYNHPEVLFPFGEDVVVSLLPEFDWDTQASVRQPLYTGGQLEKAHQQAKVGAERSRENLRSAEEELLLRLVTSYLTVARGDALMDVEKQSVELAQQRLDRAQAFYEAGEVTRVDVLRARAAIKGAERRLAAARSLRETAVGALRVVLVADGEIEVERPDDVLPPPPGEAALVARALETRPELAEARFNLELARLEVEKVKGGRRPSLLAEAALVQQKSNFPAERFVSVNVGVAVPIYQGGSVAARVAVAEERELQARLGVEELRLAVREEVRSALVELETAETTLGLAGEQLAAVEAEHEQVSDLYEALEATSLDVAASELALAEARRAVVNSALDRDLAQVRLYYTTGDLKAALLEEATP